MSQASPEPWDTVVSKHPSGPHPDRALGSAGEADTDQSTTTATDDPREFRAFCRRVGCGRAQGFRTELQMSQVPPVSHLPPSTGGETQVDSDSQVCAVISSGDQCPERKKAGQAVTAKCVATVGRRPF